MSNPWGGIGSWAADAEREESEEAAAAAAAPPPFTRGTIANNNVQSFPTLKEGVSTKQKKKKMTTFTLSQFHETSGSSGRAPASRTTGLTPEEMLQLPTGPKQRSPDEYSSGGRLGGGFSGYGRSGGFSGRRDGDSDGSWGGRRSYGGFDDDQRGPSRRDPDFDMPSRADQDDNWGAGKRAMAPPPAMDSGRVSKYVTLGGGSRADDVDSWTKMKPPMQPAPPPMGRSSAFGSGFRDSGFDSDRWRRGEEREGDSVGGRRRLVLDPPTERAGNEQPVAPPPVEQTSKTNPFGQARPREEILAEKGLDWKKIDLEIEVKKSVGSRPTSSQGSRPSSAQSGRSEGTGLGIGSEVVAIPRPKVNPFGDAKPREVVLEEKGKDWRKIDAELEHRRVDRELTDAEKELKEEIENLKKDLENLPASDPLQDPEADQSSLRDQIQSKERDLVILSKELDDKVRFGQKAIERPGSGAGRLGNHSERPPSRGGSVDDVRNVEYMDRPRSRGRGEGWARPGEDRRGGFQVGKDRGGFLGSRDYERGNSRDRW